MSLTLPGEGWDVVFDGESEEVLMLLSFFHTAQQVQANTVQHLKQYVLTLHIKKVII